MKTKSLAACLLLGLLTGGCGFHPLYAGGAVDSAFAGIYVEPVADTGVAHTGYELRNALIDLLDSNQGPAAYRLQISLGETSQGSALQNDATITRYNDTLTIRYTLTSTATGAVVAKGTETGLSAYNVAASPYATLAAQQDADKRVALDMAERIRIDLGVYFHQRTSLAR